MNINFTIIGQSLIFISFVLFSLKFIWPVLLGVMEEREKRIAEGLENADRAGKDLELAQKRAGETLREAKEQAAQIVNDANKRAAQIIEEAKEQGRVEGERKLATAKQDIEREISSAREALRGQVATLAIAGAEKVLGTTVDAKAHASMLDKLATEL